jgi:hypothetical protein
MKNFRTFIDKKSKYIIIIFFLAFFILGLFVFKDYGISTDEPAQMELGHNTFNLIAQADRTIFTQPNRFHGTVFALSAALIEKIFNIREMRTLYLTKHFMVFLLFFFSVILFFLLCRNIFKNWKWGLLASLMLILSPRIFADSFYNPKDLPLLSAFIISIYTLNLYLEAKTTTRAIIHGIATAFAISIRVLGIVVPFITLIIFIADLFLNKNEKAERYKEVAGKIKSILIYFFILAIFLLLFLPILWENPIGNFIATFKLMSQFEHATHELYMGSITLSTHQPWHYLIVYLFVTTPIFYSLLFFAGLVFMLVNLREIKSFYKNEKYKIVAAMWFFMPLLAVIILKSTIYNGWRQSYFIYPAFIILAINGLSGLFNLAEKKLAGKKLKVTTIFLIATIAFNSLFLAQLMIREHPNQFVYFNILAGKNMEVVKSRFYLDYWYLSYKQGLEYILKNDDRETIRVMEINGPEDDSAGYIFSREQRTRLVFVNDFKEADYLLHNFRADKYKEYDLKNEVFSVKVGGTKIMEVYKLK